MSTGKFPGRGGTPRSGWDQVVAEKLRILRLLRALDRAGVDPEREVAVRVPLVRLSEIDGLLAALLEFIDREGGASESEFLDSIHSPLPIAETLRGDVVDALPKRAQTAVRRASAEVTANESEIRMEVEAFRQRAPGARRSGRPLPAAEAQRIADEAWTAEASAARTPVDRRVAVHERKPLPRPDDPLRVWFERLPRPWRETMAVCHDIPREGPGALALRLATRVSDPVWMRHFLTDRLGASEREMLARYLVFPAVEVDPDDADTRESIYVAWDWMAQPPASTGGKLRLAGLVHVGSEGGKMLAILPPPLLPMLKGLLQDVDPVAALLPERAARHAAAVAMQDEPFADPALAHWKQVDQVLSRRIGRWAQRMPGELRPAVDLAMEGGDRVVESQEEGTGLYEYALLDWRPAPGKPTLAEKIIATETFDSDDKRGLAEKISRSLPVMFRVGEPEPGVGVLLTPLFPAGDPVFVTDRGLSLTVERGQVVALRVYPAGGFWFARVVTLPRVSRMEKMLLRGLARGLRAFARDGGERDPAAFLHARPHMMIKVSRTCGS